MLFSRGHRHKRLTPVVVLFITLSALGAASAQLPKSGTLTVDPSQIALDYTKMTQTDISIPGKPGPGITALAFAPDGRTHATMYADGRFVLEFEDRLHYIPAKPLTLPPGTTAKTLTFSPNGKFLAVGIDQHVLVWQVATGRQIADIAGRLAGGAVLAFSPNGKVLAAAGLPTDAGVGATSPGDDVVLWDASGLSAANPAKPLKFLKEFSVLHGLGGMVIQIVWSADSIGLNCVVSPDHAAGVLVHRYVCFQIPPNPSHT